MVEPKRARRTPRAAASSPAAPKREGDARTPRKLVLPDELWDRLQLLAIRRRSDVSRVVVEILEANVPKLWIGGPVTTARTAVEGPDRD